jgi:hypothetical protein
MIIVLSPIHKIAVLIARQEKAGRVKGKTGTAESAG